MALFRSTCLPLTVSLVLSLAACGESVTDVAVQGVGGSSTSSQVGGAGGAGGWERCDGPERWERLPGDPSLPDLHDVSVWTGGELILWGGWYAGRANTGLRYASDTDTWSPLVGSDPPSAAQFPRAAWAGSRFVVWRGVTPPEGAIYNPSSDAWSPMGDFGEPLVSVAVVSTGTRVLFWGISPVDPYPTLGGIFHPIANSWAPMSLLGAPPQLAQTNAVWTGKVMVVWGGAEDSFANTLGVYDPETDSWLPASLDGAPQPRWDPAVVWTDAGMFVWGGSVSGPLALPTTGGIYDPDTDSWRATETQDAPAGRQLHRALWTGSRVIVFPGTAPDGVSRLGGLYDPATDSWTAMGSAPEEYYPQHVAWDGCRAITVGASNMKIEAWAYHPPPR